MQNMVRKPGQATQCASLIQIAYHRRDAELAQCGHTLQIPRQCQQVHTTADHLGHAQTDVATTDDEYALTAKTGRQGADGGGVYGHNDSLRNDGMQQG